MEPIIPTRRGLITGLICFAAAPAIVRASSLMPVKVLTSSIPIHDYDIVQRWFVIIENQISNPLDASEGLPPAYKVTEILKKEDALKKYGDKLAEEQIVFKNGYTLPDPDFKPMVVKPNYVIEKPYEKVEELKC